VNRRRALATSPVALVFLLGSSALAQPAIRPSPDLPWSFRLNFGESYENNAQFISSGPNDFANRVDAALGRNWLFPRGTFKFNGNVTKLTYRDESGLNQLTYGLSSSASVKATPRLLWDVGGNFTSSYAQDINTLVSAGLIFPKVQTQVGTISTQVSYAMSPRDQLRVAVSGQKVNFTGQQNSLTPLFGGENLTYRVNYGRLVGPGETLGVSWGQTFSNGITGDILGLLGTYQREFTNGITIYGSAGIRPYTLPGQSGYRFAPGGSAGITKRAGLRHTFGAGYERAVEQAYGFQGTHIADRFSATYAALLSSRLSADASAYYGLNTYPLDPSFRLEGRTVGGGVSYRIVHDLSASAAYTYWQRIERPTPAVTTFRATFTLTYGFSWR